MAFDKDDPRISLSVNIRTSLRLRMNDWSDEYNTSLAVLVEKAVDGYLRRVETRRAQKAGRPLKPRHVKTTEPAPLTPGEDTS